MTGTGQDRTGQGTLVPGQLVQEHWNNILCGDLEFFFNSVNSIKNKQHTHTHIKKKNYAKKEETFLVRT